MELQLSVSHSTDMTVWLIRMQGTVPAIMFRQHRESLAAWLTRHVLARPAHPDSAHQL
jgi:hypothetical protein